MLTPNDLVTALLLLLGLVLIITGMAIASWVVGYCAGCGWQRGRMTVAHNLSRRFPNSGPWLPTSNATHLQTKGVAIHRPMPVPSRNRDPYP